jgi:hypothetical protein
VEPGVGVPTTFVDEDWLGWVGHCIDDYELEVSAISGQRWLQVSFLYALTYTYSQETYKQKSCLPWSGVKVVLCSIELLESRLPWYPLG